MSFQEYFDEGLYQRDTDLIDTCSAKQGAIYATYRVTADELDVDPEPVPHIYEDHEEKALRCRITTGLSHAVGATISLGWSWAESGHSIPVSAAAILLYITIASVLDVSCVALVPRAAFIRNFRIWFIPMVPVSLGSSAILLAERFASPDWAALLLTLDTAAWLGLEFSMLVLGAVAMVGERRFGWSGALTREYQALENKILSLRRKIDARKRAARTPEPEKTNKSQHAEKAPPFNAGGVAGLLLAIGLLCMPAVVKGCAGVFPDQTGSVAEQVMKEERLSTALAAGIAALPDNPCITVTPFSANPFSAVGHEISFTEYKPVMFARMRKALEAKRKIEALDKIHSSLRPPLPIAGCSNISDALILAAGAPGNALVYTDGKHDCAVRPTFGITSEHTVIVVLVRSLKDGESNAETFSKRRAATLKMMPKAIVLPEFDLDQAVRMLFQMDRMPELINAMF